MMEPDSRLDLVLDRVVDAPRRLVRAAWRSVECETGLRPGGMFRTVLRSPEGEDFLHSAAISMSCLSGGLRGRACFSRDSGPRRPERPERTAGSCF